MLKFFKSGNLRPEFWFLFSGTNLSLIGTYLSKVFLYKRFSNVLTFLLNWELLLHKSFSLILIVSSFIFFILFSFITLILLISLLFSLFLVILFLNLSLFLLSFLISFSLLILFFSSSSSSITSFIKFFLFPPWLVYAIYYINK